jgi:hypothetical protein
MPESSEDKSKRIFIEHLDSCNWQYQVSIFYQSYRSSRDAIEHSKEFRKWISRYHPHKTLWRLVLRNTESFYIPDAPIGKTTVTMPYHTLFFTVKPNIKKIAEKFESICRNEVNVKNQKVTPEKLNSYKNSVNNQKPHNLNMVFFERKINRFSILNKNK